MFLVGWLGVFSLILLRRSVPESPRWLILKRRTTEAKQIIAAIEETVRRGESFMGEAGVE